MSACHKILSVKKIKRKNVVGENASVVHYRLILEGLPDGHNVISLPWYRFLNQTPKVGKYAYWGPIGYRPALDIEKMFDAQRFGLPGYQWHILNEMVTAKPVFACMPGKPDVPANYRWQILKEQAR